MSEQENLSPKAATAATAAANAQVYDELPFGDTRSYDDARRGFIGTLDPPVALTAEGNALWDMRQYEFLDGEAPDTVNPSLWRNAQLNAIHGLFKVSERVYQVRGFDLSNLTVIVGDTGYILNDVMSSTETAAAAFELVKKHLGDKPVKAIIVTHSHVDHFGGIRAFVTDEQLASGEVQFIAPDGFHEHAASENIYTGNAMIRRALYMYGPFLERGGKGQVSAGLGSNVPIGTLTLMEPNVVITETATELTIDGLKFIFQLTPGTEAPAEMNYYLPELKAICCAENSSFTMHNLYTLRGAQVRDAKAWYSYLTQTIDWWGEDAQSMFGMHHWPVWGSAEIKKHLTMQRDLYQYIHDETLRYANHGYTMTETAERIKLPESLRDHWGNRGYYGTLNHNSKAVWQRYLGWFDGNPANLHPIDTVAQAKKYVEYMGGIDAVIAKARADFEAGEYRWVAEIMNKVVFADPQNREAREFQADVLEQLGYQAESGPWRNFYLSAGVELRHGLFEGVGPGGIAPDLLRGMTAEMLFDYLGIRLNGPKAGGLELVINIAVDDGAEHNLTVRNGVLVADKGLVPNAAVTARGKLFSLTSVFFDSVTVDDALAAGDLALEGSREAFDELLDLLDTFGFWFNIITPRP